jgi:hypothetical protein
MRLVASAWLCSSTCSTERSSHDSTERSFHTNGSGVRSLSRRRFCGIRLLGVVQVGSGVSEVQAAFGATHGALGYATKTNLSAFGGPRTLVYLLIMNFDSLTPAKRAIAIPAPITKETHRSLAFLGSSMTTTTSILKIAPSADHSTIRLKNDAFRQVKRHLGSARLVRELVT